jgi:hypothetical protein
MDDSKLYRIRSVLEEIFDQSTPQYEVQEIINLLCEGVESYRLYAFELGEIISILLKKYPDLFLDIVFNGRDGEGDLAYQLFQDRMHRDAGTLNDAPLDKLLTWCGDDQERIVKVASSVRMYSSNDPSNPSDENPKSLVLSEHIKALLEVALDKLAVVEVIFENSRPGSWSGSLAEILEVRAKAFEELLEYPDSKVQTLVRTKLAILAQWVNAERERESSEQTGREQRFE